MKFVMFDFISVPARQMHEIKAHIVRFQLSKHCEYLRRCQGFDTDSSEFQYCFVLCSTMGKMKGSQLIKFQLFEICMFKINLICK